MVLQKISKIMIAGRMIYPLNNGCKSIKILLPLTEKLQFTKVGSMCGLTSSYLTIMKKHKSFT